MSKDINVPLSLKTANTFVSLGVRSPLKLQKLMYMAHGHALVLREGELTDEPFEAWLYGPVIRSLYTRIKEKCLDISRRIIENYGMPENCIWDLDKLTLQNRKRDFVRFVYEAYKNYTSAQLVDITHQEGGAWSQTIKKQGRNAEIKNSLIQREFKKKKLIIQIV